MHKSFLILVILFLYQLQVYPREKIDILTELDNAINQKAMYDLEKEKRIADTKKAIKNTRSLLQEYQLNELICNEYQKFKLDSAIRYSKRNIEIANSLNNTDFSNNSQLRLAVLYSSSGKYREAETILESIDRKSLPTHILPAYYEAYCLFFNYYSSNIQNDDYNNKIAIYRDSLLNLLNPKTDKYIITKAEKDIYQRDNSLAEKDLLLLLNNYQHNTSEYAMITYLLGIIYKDRDEMELAIEYFARSALADIQHSVKDNASMRFLASIFYDEDNIDRAYRYAQSAIDDAVFCNVQFRTVLMSEFYTIINAAYTEKEAKRKTELKTYSILISILAIFLIFAVIYIYRQMKKVSRIRKELHSTNEKLNQQNTVITKINKQLNQKNALLSESNHIKEEYIAHFFDLCSTYINKLENYRKSLNKKANDRRLDELFKILKSTTIVDNELEELYRNFDTIFINLYPTFVEDFNTLFPENERTTLKQGEILNTELRIFALIRLGITDSVKIAAFLRYSLSTIYNYRTKARNKTIVPRDEFEKTVMNIGSYYTK